jgi:hypothetical protein
MRALLPPTFVQVTRVAVVTDNEKGLKPPPPPAIVTLAVATAVQLGCGLGLGETPGLGEGLGVWANAGITATDRKITPVMATSAQRGRADLGLKKVFKIVLIVWFLVRCSADT